MTKAEIKAILEQIEDKKADCLRHYRAYSNLLDMDSVSVNDTVVQNRKQHIIRAFNKHEALCELAEKMGIKVKSNVVAELPRMAASELLHIVWDN